MEEKLQAPEPLVEASVGFVEWRVVVPRAIAEFIRK